MKSEKVKQFLDYIPFLILIVEAIILIWDIITTEYLISWQHYLGLILILIVAGLFFWKHKAGVLTLVFILLLGVLGLISFDIAITTITFGKGGDFVFFTCNQSLFCGFSFT